VVVKVFKRRKVDQYSGIDQTAPSMRVRISNWFRANKLTVKKAMHIFLIIIGVLVAANIGLLLLQNGRTPLLTRINGKAYGLMPLDKAKELLKADHTNTNLTLSVEDQTIVMNAQTSGVSVDADKTLDSIVKRVGLEHIPMVKSLANLFVQVRPQYSVDQEVLAKALEAKVKESLIQPKNATIKVPAEASGKVEVIPSENGQAQSPVIAADQISDKINETGLTLKVEPKVLTPDITTKALKDFLPAVEAARKTTMTVQTSNKKLELTSSVLAPQLKVVSDGTTLKLTLDEEGIADYLQKQSAVFYQAAIATSTVQQDGVEVSRTPGTAGSRLDAKATAALVVKDFENNVLDVTASVAAVQPEIQVKRTYSNSDAGLKALIEQFAQSHAGVYRVVAVQLSGSGSRSAFYNSDTVISTASIYKIFVAYAALLRIEQGTLTKDTQTSAGTVDYCINRMIVVSDNPCGEALISYMGATNIDNVLSSKGFTSTKVAKSKTTASDTFNLLAKMYNHEILTKASVDYLFSFMGQQIYRQGIPAGSKGALVQDKVGFLNGLYHDAGIVYSPKATYALVILTDGAGGFSNIKQLSQQIYDFYNQ